MIEEQARAIMGKNVIGSPELAKLPWLPERQFSVSPIPFTELVLRARSHSHLLIFAPSVGITIRWLRGAFGTDPAHEPCMYNQDWYDREAFATMTTLDGQWHLLRKEVLEDVRARQPDDIEMSLDGEQFPTAITCAFTFFAWWHLYGEALWKHDFVWCADRDHDDNRIYVGRYEDPKGINKNGFNIHRHLVLSPAYSSAPEVIT